MDMSNMSGMDMGTTATAAATATATSTGTASATTTASMDMSMMDMDMSSMNTYLTTTFHDYPVIFKGLKAANGGSAFGIFVLLFAVAFIMRGIFFLSAYIEQKIYYNYTLSAGAPAAHNEYQHPFGSSQTKSGYYYRSSGSTLKQIFFPGFGEFLKDVTRLVTTFVAAMLGYALMLAAMSFVVLYFFAICLGIAFGEVFFNRLAIVLDVNQNSSLCGTLH